VSTPPRPTTVDQVVDAIRDGIKFGRFAPGQRLVEADLTEELGVSRGPLREALGRLATQGLLIIEPYRGAVVRRWTRDDIIELFAVREVLEGEAARSAAARINDGDHRSAFERVVEEIGGLRQLDGLDGFLQENTLLHESIVSLSGNRMLAGLIDQLSTNAYRVQFRNIVVGGAAAQSMVDHDAVIRALLDGNPPAAEQAMRRHVRGSLQLTLQLFDDAPQAKRIGNR
jgi:DNA-binding GntR family transcriptional regulator